MSAYLYGAGAGAILVLSGLLWWRGGQLERVRGEFGAYKAAQAQLVADSLKAAQIKSQEAEAHNAQVMADLQGRLDGSIADGTRLAVRLRLALAGAGAGPLPQDTGQPGAAPASGVAGETEAARRTLAAFADYDASCVRDTARLDALIAEVKPQL